ncbi:pentatricopeptide repeat-containing protein At1g19720 [Ricinus communis]|uniref:pentatricopeptide repeat-containing protein At1g19720 n=1 Tax=Ricinus communis TaxID=3988 RepID=UPI0007722FDA|nr:pentatricopeptide repeat-containing protein At1g19720 [Ricinus communis]XP_015573466.1 pentatricopeptide repeat-containing protein At1g19720 [Ricinus communis]|eukprot:XP_015573463.1 pentatricopeptide repeat-containing protein At1g19720 [Ricinus communis]
MENLIMPIIKKSPISIPNEQDTLSAFSTKPTKSSVPFTKKITDSHLNYLCKKGRLNEAVSALELIAQHGSKVSPKTFISLLQSCIDCNSVTLGRKVHAHFHLVQEKNPFLETKLVSMYAKCGSLSDARKLFGEMREKNLYTWSAMIGAFSREHRWKEVVELFYMMMEENCLPDAFLLPKILQACGNSRDIKSGEMVHSLAIKCGVDGYPFVNNSILAVYAKCGKLSLASKCFEMMDKSETAAWNALISGYCQHGQIEEAQRLFDAMREEGIEPGLVSWNILIAGYNQLGYFDIAMELMKKMEVLGTSPDVVTWTSMISGLAQNDKASKALHLFNDMILARVEPNGVTISSAVSACASLKVLNEGLEIHALAVKLGFVEDVLVGNSLIDMYSKCGKLENAWKVFDMMPEKDVYTWNSMIGGYCQVGYCGKAHMLFMKMQKSETQPNAITWNNMIWGYIHNGDEDQAMDLFRRMEEDGKIKRDTASWNSLISGYLQIGQKDKALSIFRQMQSFSININSVTILSVLPACANLIALKMVKEIHGCVIRRNLDSLLPITNSLIDTYAKSGNIGYSRTIFDRALFKDFITWNSLIAGYVLFGCSDAALGLVDQMKKLGIKPNRSTFVSIILAYSLAGLVGEGEKAFYSMMEDYQITPSLEHFSAMVHLYGRSAKLKEAMEFIEDMPMTPDFYVWSALLNASLIHGNFGLAIHAGENLLNLEPGNPVIRQLVSQAYVLYGKPKVALKVKCLKKNNKVLKLIGESWIEVKNNVHSFLAGDQSKSNSDLLFSWVQSIIKEVKACDLQHGYCIEEEEKEEIIGTHSEKLALSFAFVCAPSAPQSIRIVKNLRMCADCHRMAKYISMKYGCEIYLSDSNCLHHFKSGHCSCGDYW